ncbi:hypothetical protein [Rhizobium sp. MHM7A]|uniref:hypothetical protein n=1 Tax=Rhizobium sp. MHM7A TaxID=2583233 RepID=UPI0011073100|nr:hypothetical protein [Rhizobium sp. MHM7A]TLX16161.1 hypothetical protein FFR93_02210 [Rhizobium sp. MHM7A]
MDLASAVFQWYSLPDYIVVEDTSGFSSETTSTTVDLSKPVFYYNKEGDHLLHTDDYNTSTADFNIKIELETGEITDAYFITQSGGNILGEFTEDNRREAYEGAGLADLLRLTCGSKRVVIKMNKERGHKRLPPQEILIEFIQPAPASDFEP